jgi:hypothetical protein
VPAFRCLNPIAHHAITADVARARSVGGQVAVNVVANLIADGVLLTDMDMGPVTQLRLWPPAPEGYQVVPVAPPHWAVDDRRPV